MNELLREIQEDIRSENAEKLWKNFGQTAIRVSIAVVIGTVIAVAWNHYKKTTEMEATAQLMKGMEMLAAGDQKNVLQAFEVLNAKGNTVYGAIAMLQTARAQESLGQHDEAHKTYQALAAKSASGDNSAFIALAKLATAKETDASVAPAQQAPFSSLHSSRFSNQCNS